MAIIGNVATASSTSDLSSYTFSTVAVGSAPAGADRRFVFVLAGVSDMGAIGTVTINGGATTLVQGYNAADNTAGVGIAYAEVASGTTVNVVVSNFGGSATGCGITVVAVTTGAGGITVGTPQTSRADPLAWTLDLPALSVGLGVVSTRNGNTNTWTGLTERQDADLKSDDHVTTAASDYTTQSLGQAIGCDPSVAASVTCGLVVAVYETSSSTNYSLISDVGAFTLTGIAAALLRAQFMLGAVGSFTFTGRDALFPMTRKVVADVGAFALTGVAALFKLVLGMIAAVGTFTLSGVAAGTLAARKMAADLGAFILTGIDATLNAGKTIAADVGTFVLTGIAALFRVTLTAIAAAGTFTLTGVAAGTLAARKIAADLGTFTLTGIAALFKIAKKIAADVGTFTLTGIAALLNAGKTIAANVGTFTLSGIAVNLIIPGLAILAEAGTFLLSEGVQPLLTWVHRTVTIVGDRGIETLTGLRRKAASLQVVRRAKAKLTNFRGPWV